MTIWKWIERSFSVHSLRNSVARVLTRLCWIIHCIKVLTSAFEPKGLKVLKLPKPQSLESTPKYFQDFIFFFLCMLSPRHRVFSVCFSRQEVTCGKFRRAQPNLMSASLYIFYLQDWQKRRGSDQMVVRFRQAGDVNPSHRSARSAIMLPISISSSHHVYEMEALPCAGWCDPQIDSFIRNDKRWVWTGLLIWQSLECQRDGWWGGPPLLSPPSPSPWLRPLIPPSTPPPPSFSLAQLKVSPHFKREISNWIKIARSPKTESRAP